jgi:hypothetical protein
MEIFDFFENSYFFNVIVLKLSYVFHDLKVAGKKFENRSFFANFSHIL